MTQGSETENRQQEDQQTGSHRYPIPKTGVKGSVNGDAIETMFQIHNGRSQEEKPGSQIQDPRLSTAKEPQSHRKFDDAIGRDAKSGKG
ncbi:hypothetical protein MMC08_005944 [Hypocenomyce scalaris]|nr:hypothetical protein [Hypocenomyce scalaris]